MWENEVLETKINFRKNTRKLFLLFIPTSIRVDFTQSFLNCHFIVGACVLFFITRSSTFRGRKKLNKTNGTSQLKTKNSGLVVTKKKKKFSLMKNKNYVKLLTFDSKKQTDINYPFFFFF